LHRRRRAPDFPAYLAAKTGLAEESVRAPLHGVSGQFICRPQVEREGFE
jgi:hypothetical protein